MAKARAEEAPDRVRVVGTVAERILVELMLAPSTEAAIRKRLGLERFQAFRGFAALRKYGLVQDVVSQDLAADDRQAARYIITQAIAMRLNPSLAASSTEPLVELTSDGRLAASVVYTARQEGAAGGETWARHLVRAITMLRHGVLPSSIRWMKHPRKGHPEEAFDSLVPAHRQEHAVAP